MCRKVALRDWSKSTGDGMGWSREGGSLVFEPLVRGGSLNFQLPIGVGHPVFFLMGIGTHLTQSTTKVKPLSNNKASDTLKHQPMV